MRFTATLDLNGKTATGFRVPPEVIEALGAGKRPRVTATINGYSFPYTVAVMGGEYLIGVNADVREAANVKAGDLLDVELEVLTTPEELVIPGDVRSALDGHPEALRFFSSLTFSQKRRYIQLVEDAKTPETRQRRIDKAISNLLAGEK